LDSLLAFSALFFEVDGLGASGKRSGECGDDEKEQKCFHNGRGMLVFGGKRSIRFRGGGGVCEGL
jgi:hypothetical protein